MDENDLRANCKAWKDEATTLRSLLQEAIRLGEAARKATLEGRDAKPVNEWYDFVKEHKV